MRLKNDEGGGYGSGCAREMSVINSKLSKKEMKAHQRERERVENELKILAGLSEDFQGRHFRSSVEDGGSTSPAKNGKEEEQGLTQSQKTKKASSSSPKKK